MTFVCSNVALLGIGSSVRRNARLGIGSSVRRTAELFFTHVADNELVEVGFELNLTLYPDALMLHDHVHPLGEWDMQLLTLYLMELLCLRHKVNSSFDKPVVLT
jgi:hypothetical protein